MMIGSTISHYRILEKLGEGGMGVVYKAQDTKLDRTVALKFLPSHLSASEQDKARFIQEARTASALNHPNVCTIYEINESDDRMFIAMEYVEGRTLREAKQGLTIRQAADIVAQVAEGLGTAHEKGFIHRDIKTDNIMLRPDGRVQIMDFGLAKLQGVSSMTKAGSTIGTTAYMSPEQVRGEEPDHRTDIFALGVVMYELLTGRHPFQGAHEAAMMYEIVNVDPPSVRVMKPEIEPNLEHITMKCLEKERENRYQSAREIAVDLRRFRRDSVEKQRPRSSVGTHLQSVAGKRTWLKVAVPLLLMVVTAVVAWFFLYDRVEVLDSLAVLPFENAGGDENMEYLSDGITESLINSLSQLPQLRVRSRSSVFHYKGKEINPEKAGKELGVKAVLTGRVAQRGDNLFVSTELVDVSNNSHVWGEQYNRKLSDLIMLQEELSREISGKLSLKFATEETRKLTKRSTENTEAFQLYLKGRYHWNKRSSGGLKKAIEFFQQAVDKDPNYALAYSGIADAYVVLAWFEYGILSPRDAYPKAKAAAERAVEIDPDRAESYVSLAFVNMVFDRDWVATERNFNRAFEISPSYATAHHWYAEFLAVQGRLNESVERMKHALTLDPLSLIITRDVGWMLYFARRYDEANEYIRKALEFDPSFYRGYLLLGLNYIQQGLIDKAIAEFETAARLAQGPIATIMLAYCHARTGRTGEAQKTLNELLTRSSTTYIPAGGIALIYLGLGDRDRAFEWLTKAHDERSGLFVFMKIDPLFDGIRDDPRYAALLSKAGLSA